MIKRRNIILLVLFLIVVSSCKEKRELKNKLKPFLGEYEWSHSIVFDSHEVYQGISSYTIVDTLDTVGPLDYKFSYSLEITKNRSLIFYKNKIKWDKFKIKSITPYNTIEYGKGGSQDYMYLSNDTISYFSNKSFDVFIPFFTFNNLVDTAGKNVTSVYAEHFFIKQ